MLCIYLTKTQRFEDKYTQNRLDGPLAELEAADVLGALRLGGPLLHPPRLPLHLCLFI